ncbi:MAG TPA: CehA/McbA family metallohydrolase [Actinomycetes bacterium]|nr:CehA/McbA family metallohydrolase [Actinomycetes bacterium]
MLARYRALAAERPLDWGDEFENYARGQPYGRWLGNRLLTAVFTEQLDDWPATVRACLTDPLPAGLVVASVGAGGIGLRAGPVPYLLEGGAVEVAVLLDSSRAEATRVEVDGTPVPVGAGGVELVTRTVTGPGPLAVGAARATVAQPAGRARLRLRAQAPSRWSVVDDRGGAWFPDGRPPKWDFHDRPLFHGHDLELEVPAVPLTVTCTRGMEFATATTTLTPRAGSTTEVELEPERLYETAARSWYGGDLHVHMNYSGDQVAGPDDAACMQAGEGLHLMSLVAGNISQTRVYDREAFEATAGQDLPWTDRDQVARFGVEYRNDLLGHFHALGPVGRPSRYHSGHEGSDEPFDWPANAAACQEFRELGATVGYTHPVFSPLADGTPAAAFGFPRSVEARELVADAALSLVDSVDLIGPSDVEGTAVLYHHLLSCGLRLAATVGTDVWLSYSRGPLFSNPPGWGRVYADLRGAPLSVAAFAAAIRAGRTLATNGPFIELAVAAGRPGRGVPRPAAAGHGPLPGPGGRAAGAGRPGRRPRRRRGRWGSAPGDRRRGRGRRLAVAVRGGPRPRPPVGPGAGGVRPHQPGLGRGRGPAGPPPGQRPLAAGLAGPVRGAARRARPVRRQRPARRGRGRDRPGPRPVPGDRRRPLC